MARELKDTELAILEAINAGFPMVPIHNMVIDTHIEEVASIAVYHTESGTKLIAKATDMKLGAELTSVLVTRGKHTPKKGAQRLSRPSAGVTHLEPEEQHHMLNEVLRAEYSRGK